MTSLIKSEQSPYRIICFFSPWTQAVYIQILRQQKECSQSKIYSRKHPDPKPPDAEILELLYINLTRNDFEFNGQYYLQTKGTAMGKRFAPAYANIYSIYGDMGRAGTPDRSPENDTFGDPGY